MNARRRALGFIVLASSIVAGCASAPDAVTSPTPSVSVPGSVPHAGDRPAPPTGLRIVATAAGSIELAWDAPTEGEVTSWVVTRVSAAGRTVRVEVSDPALVDGGLDDGTVHTYRVVAVSDGGASEPSDPVTALAGVDLEAPSAPGAPLASERTPGEVVLTWSPSRDLSGISHYAVTRTVGGESTPLTATEPTFTDEIGAGVVATYAVRAIDRAGNESKSSRAVTLLTGRTGGDLVLVLGTADLPDDDTAIRLRDELLAAGYVVSWFASADFDADLATADDLVVLPGDLPGAGFDWRLFDSDAAVVAMKSSFVEAAAISAGAPDLDRLAQLDWFEGGDLAREVVLTTTGRPKPVPYVAADDQSEGLEVWGRPVWSDSIAVAGIVPAGGTLADGDQAPGCRAFFPGSTDALDEFTDDAWSLLVEMIGAVDRRCR